MARFFTILTMVLVVIAFFTVAISKTRGLSAPTLASLTLSVVMTGAVYHVLLAEFWNPTGLGIVADIGPAHGGARGRDVVVAVPRAQDVADLGRSSGLRALALGLHGLCAGAGQHRRRSTPTRSWTPDCGCGRSRRRLAILGVLILLGGVVMIGIGRFADR
jgi:hypothetical protein